MLGASSGLLTSSPESLSLWFELTNTPSSRQLVSIHLLGNFMLHFSNIISAAQNTILVLLGQGVSRVSKLASKRQLIAQFGYLCELMVFGRVHWKVSPPAIQGDSVLV